ncbi:MAG: methyltransferase domain-containing protein [Rhodospirillales bacterium]|jgi:SAM-dependent methyltransferase|nr:methyltransferase domain-containing protein [Rhodospirillales bacterium]
MPDSMTVFDRALVRRRRDRAAAGLVAHDFLYREVADRLADRLDDVNRRFPLALDLGCHTGALAAALAGRGGIETMVQCDLSAGMAAQAPAPVVAGDEEALPFANGVFDLVLSSLSLHWVNDLPGALSQIRRALKPDGLFLAAMPGGQTLKELRHALAEAEIAEEGGLSPRISPFVDVRDAGNLLVRAGFALPVADLETITVSYPDPLAVVRDLRGAGEANAVIERRRGPSRRTTLFAALARYSELYADADGRVPATVQVIYLTAWAPDPSQPKPLKPGSARTRLAEALGTAEIPAGEKAAP